MPRKIKIRMTKMNSTTPAKNTVNMNNNVSLLNREIGILESSDESMSAIFVGMDAATGYNCIGPIILPKTIVYQGNLVTGDLPGFIPLYSVTDTNSDVIDNTNNPNYVRRARIVGIEYILGSGSATVSLKKRKQRNTTAITIQSSISVNTTLTRMNLAPSNTETYIGAHEYIYISVDSISSAANLSFNIFISYY